MTKEAARAALLLYAVHAVERFIKERDEELATQYPGYEMGIGWIDPVKLCTDFGAFQSREFERQQKK